MKAEKFLFDFYGTLREGLKDKLGCVLFQTPERMAYKEEKLEQIIDSLDPTFSNVLEFRNASWWNQHVYDKLAEHNITFCGMSHPLLPEHPVENTSTLYYRFHGIPELYKSKYDVKILRKFVREIEANQAIKRAFIYFNNDIDASAITNAYEMEAYIDKLQKRSSKK